jgi:hypothetical protein
MMRNLFACDGLLYFTLPKGLHEVVHRWQNPALHPLSVPADSPLSSSAFAHAAKKKMSASLLQIFEQYQKARVQFVQAVAEAATRPQNVDVMQNAGVMQLLRPLLLDNVSGAYRTHACCKGVTQQEAAKHPNRDIFTHADLPPFSVVLSLPPSHPRQRAGPQHSADGCTRLGPPGQLQ